MRSLVKTIDQMLELIPSDQPELRARLENRKRSAPFTPPECIAECWQEVAFILAHHMGDDATKFNPWQLAVRDIYNGPGGGQ